MNLHIFAFSFCMSSCFLNILLFSAHHFFHKSFTHSFFWFRIQSFMHFFVSSNFSCNSFWFVINCWHMSLNLHLLHLFLYLFCLFLLLLLVILLIIQKLFNISFILVLGRRTSVRLKSAFFKFVFFFLFSNPLLGLVFTRFKIFRPFLKTSYKFCMGLRLL